MTIDSTGLHSIRLGDCSSSRIPIQPSDKPSDNPREAGRRFKPTLGDNADSSLRSVATPRDHRYHAQTPVAPDHCNSRLSRIQLGSVHSLSDTLSLGYSCDLFTPTAMLRYATPLVRLNLDVALQPVMARPLQLSLQLDRRSVLAICWTTSTHALLGLLGPVHSHGHVSAKWTQPGYNSNSCWLARNPCVVVQQSGYNSTNNQPSSRQPVAR